jgi:hypothetical protein
MVLVTLHSIDLAQSFIGCRHKIGNPEDFLESKISLSGFWVNLTKPLVRAVDLLCRRSCEHSTLVGANPGIDTLKVYFG